MRKLATLTLAVAFLLATGCAPKSVMKQWEASGGSRADATVEVAYTYDPRTERPQASDQQALQEAISRCKAWGYSSAELFGLTKDIGINMTYSAWSAPAYEYRMVTRQYQCLGQGNEPATMPVK